MLYSSERDIHTLFCIALSLVIDHIDHLGRQSMLTLHSVHRKEINLMKIRAAVVYEKDAPFVVKEIELAEPKEDEVLVKLVGCGVCHTDEAAITQFIPTPLPAVLGHEGSGIVVSVGSRVTDLNPGDHVVFCQYKCGACEYCLQGHPQSCSEVISGNFRGVYADGTRRHKDENGVELSSFFSQSSFAEYTIANRLNTIKVDSDVDPAILGPLSCGIQTGAGAVLNVLRPEAGTGIAIFGCGGVGLSAVMAAKLSGCTTIIGVDAVQTRLEMAKSLGATDIINARETGDIAEKIRHIYTGGVERALDTTGVEGVINAMIFGLRRLGIAGVCAMMPEKPFLLPLGSSIMPDQKKIVGIIEGDSIPEIFVPRLSRLYKAGLFPFDKLIKFYNFEDINQAFEDSHNGKTVKPVIRF
jgi:aryl-alcohol dehydrogenase